MPIFLHKKIMMMIIAIILVDSINNLPAYNLPIRILFENLP